MTPLMHLTGKGARPQALKKARDVDDFTNARRIACPGVGSRATNAAHARRRRRHADFIGRAERSRRHFGGPLSAPHEPHGFVANDDIAIGRGTLFGDVLLNDFGATALVSHTLPAHGKLDIGANGVFTYTPDASFRGTDSFTCSVTDAVALFPYSMQDGRPVPGLANVQGPAGTTAVIAGEGFGSSLAPAPGLKDVFFGLTDRGPNADAPDGNKSGPLPAFSPRIG